MNAADDLMKVLQPDETVEAIVFGPWGWGSAPDSVVTEQWDFGCGEPGEDTNAPPVPFELRGKLLSFEEAKPLMKGWSFRGGFGAPKCYAVYVWTNLRVIWVTQYDGSTRLDSAPRNPLPVMPEMPGG